MNSYQGVIDIIEAIVTADANLSAAISTNMPAWIDVGVPTPSSDPNATMPCVRLDGLVQSAGKYKTYTLNVHLWSEDTSIGFFDLADQFAEALQTSPQLLCESYLHRPEEALNSILIPVTFFA